jgi:hypothetical protein
MNTKQIKDLLAAVREGREGQTEALRVVDFAFEQVICEGSDGEIAEAFDLVNAFLSDAAGQTLVA